MTRTHTHDYAVLSMNHDERVQLKFLTFSVEGVII